MPNTSLRRPQNGFRRGGKAAYHGQQRPRTFAASTGARGEATSTDEKWEQAALANRIDENMGFARYEAGRRREGWLVSLQPTALEDARVPGGGGRAAVDCYFIEADGATFKATVEHEPYFLVACRHGREAEVEEWCKRVPGGGVVKTVRRVEKEDLKMPNHLMGYRRTFLELRFSNVQDLLAARRDIMPIAEKNRKGMDAMDTYAEVAAYVLSLHVAGESRGQSQRHGKANTDRVGSGRTTDSTFSTTTAGLTSDGLLLLPLPTRAIFLLTFGSLTSHTTFE